MSEALKPCPFCGSPAMLFPGKLTSDDYSVICQNPDCECNARILYCRGEIEAVREWNRRTPGADLVRELRDACADLDSVLEAWKRGLPVEVIEVGKTRTRAKAAIARADAHLEGRKPQNYSAVRIAALQEAAGRVLYACEGADDDGDLTERVTFEMLDALRQALAGLRHYHDAESPKENGR